MSTETASEADRETIEHLEGAVAELTEKLRRSEEERIRERASQLRIMNIVVRVTRERNTAIRECNQVSIERDALAVRLREFGKRGEL